jgi:hypothetical protein
LVGDRWLRVTSGVLLAAIRGCMVRRLLLRMKTKRCCR